MSGVPNAGVTLSLYSDNLSQPGQLLATLDEVSGLSSTLAPVTFGQGGYVLSANTTYWAVLQATSGSAEWGFTDSNAGSGVGFQHTWGVSDDAGEDWTTFDSYPMLLDVTGTSLSPTVSPEPVSVLLLVLGGLALLWARTPRAKLRLFGASR